MGRLIYSMITTLDGYAADRDGNFDWGVPDDEVMAALNAQTAPLGTYLMGRRMYEVMQVWETDPTLAEGSSLDREFARLWQAAEKIVYSTTLPEASTRRTRLERHFDPDAVRGMKEQSTADLSVEGTTLAAHALRNGLVDEIRQLICPVAVGGGLRFLPDLRIDLELMDVNRFSNGMVQLNYRMLNRPPAQ